MAKQSNQYPQQENIVSFISASFYLFIPSNTNAFSWSISNTSFLIGNKVFNPGRTIVGVSHPNKQNKQSSSIPPCLWHLIWLIKCLHMNDNNNDNNDETTAMWIQFRKIKKNTDAMILRLMVNPACSSFTCVHARNDVQNWIEFCVWQHSVTLPIGLFLCSQNENSIWNDQNIAKCNKRNKANIYSLGMSRNSISHVFYMSFTVSFAYC